MTEAARPGGTTERIPQAVLESWPGFATAEITRVRDGLINDTFLLQRLDRSRVILQRLHPIFGAEVNLDIAAVTGRLRAQGLTTPELIPTDAGELWVEHAGRIWRAMTHIPGASLHRLTSAAQAREAGALVGRFHAALAGFEYTYRFRRGEVHDMPRHLVRLREALENGPAHPLHAQVLHLAQPLLAATLPMAELASLPARHSHGDLKISNLLFDAAGRAICLIDLDTLGRMIWPFEMGDALRSWCNPHEEDSAGAVLELELLDAALGGYASTGPALEPEEKARLVGGLAQIALELAARFLADALEERYFGWDPDRYPSRGAHNLARGRSMAELFADILARRREAEAIVQRRLG